MEKRIHLEKRGKKASQVTELNLDNCRATSIVGFTEEYTALETLSLINVGLTTLKGFPNLPNLKKLELSDNRISTGLNYLATSPKLQSLNLSGNKIKELEALKPLQEFKNLAVLDLFNNEATLIENYREKIFEMLPSLKYLDGFDCNDVEVQSEDDDDEVNGNDSDEESDSDGIVEDDEDLEDYGEDSCSDEDVYEEDDSDVSLSEVYNEDLEEDNSEWDEDGVEEEDDDDIEDDEAFADGELDKSASKPAVVEDKASANDTEESQARGKKRKHDG